MNRNSLCVVMAFALVACAGGEPVDLDVSRQALEGGEEVIINDGECVQFDELGWQVCTSNTVVVNTKDDWQAGTCGLEYTATKDHNNGFVRWNYAEGTGTCHTDNGDWYDVPFETQTGLADSDTGVVRRERAFVTCQPNYYCDSIKAKFWFN
jgi:hypothetical protein